MKHFKRSKNMYSRHRQLPSEVSSWMEKDVKLRKLTASSGLMPNESRRNIVLRRQFFSDLLTLSSERFRKMSKWENDKKTFLKNQRAKAETSMPGLLPYVEQLTDDMNRNTPSSRCDPFASSSFQSFSSRSNVKSEALSYRRQQSARTSKSPQPIPMKSPNRALERINHLAQPKGRRFDSTANDHIRPDVVGAITVQDLFGRIDDMSSYNPESTDKSKNVSNDKRFYQLFQTFSDVHERQPSNLPTVKSIIESNTSLQDNQPRWQPINTSKSHRHRRSILADQIFKKKDMFLIDVGV